MSDKPMHVLFCYADPGDDIPYSAVVRNAPSAAEAWRFAREIAKSRLGWSDVPEEPHRMEHGLWRWVPGSDEDDFAQCLYPESRLGPGAFWADHIEFYRW